ncbi:MAG: hypothetical protein AB1403_02360 [Candidatus Riflebacteria bacterium]
MRRLILVLFLLSLCLPTFGQSLQDIMETPKTADQPVSDTSSSETQSSSSELAQAFYETPLTGMPTISRLLNFIKLLLKEILIGLKEIELAADEDYDKDPEAEGGTPEPATPDENDVDQPDPSELPETVSAGALRLPTRPEDAETGSEFMKRTWNMSPADREKEILKSILAGNIPPFLRNFSQVTVSRRCKDGKTHSISYKVLPDYLAIGTAEDFIRIPMSPIAAQAIADQTGCILPTTQMVDDIYHNAQTKMLPQPMSGGQYSNWQARMTKNEFYQEHQKLVETQRQQKGHQHGNLLAGHKKDVVISNFLNSHRDNVIIYGWHDARNQGKPIQGYGWGHEDTYADYSHGIRLMASDVTVDGKEMSIGEVLGDTVLSQLLSKEGPVKDLRAIR